MTSGTPVRGGTGGGAVKLALQNLTVNGSILVDGDNGGYNSGRSAGAGSGGSLWLSVTNLAGTGLIQAKGGTTSPNSSYGTSGGGGGGGRIALYYTASSFTGSFAANGGNSTGGSGQTGGAGTIYTKPFSAAQGTLLLDNALTSGMKGSAGTWAANADLNTLSEITITRSGVLKHASETPMDLLIPTLTINLAGSIRGSGLGYAGGYNTQNGFGTGKGYQAAGDCGGGAGYGGLGGYGQYSNGNGGSRGTTYGSIIEPTDLGSGGGGARTSPSAAVGGNGGGALKLEIRNLTVDGSILADGNSGQAPAARSGGGGSGGSIWIIARNLTGTGVIRAQGGTGPQNPSYGTASGGGGGGRIAIYYTVMPYNTNNVTAYGGSSTFDPGDKGTVYFEYIPLGGTIILFK